MFEIYLLLLMLVSYHSFKFIALSASRLAMTCHFLTGVLDHGKTTLVDSLLAKAGILKEEDAGKRRMMDFK